MFGLFKRKKIEQWEVETIKSILTKLPNDYKHYLVQIENGLLRGVLEGMSDIPNYVGFTYNSSVYNKFYKPKEKNFKLFNIKVMDNTSKSFIKITLYFSYGLINGYSIDTYISKIKLNPDDIDITSISKSYIGDNDFKSISNFLSPKEKAMINQNDVYLITLNGKDYYHLKELEDGDFIGIDLNNNLYKITQDPFEINLVERYKLESLLADKMKI
jgi:hypothetical protein